MRKAWVIAGAAAAVPFGLVGLLTVAVGAMTGSSVGTASGTVELAPGTVPAAYQNAISTAGHLCPELTPALLAAQLYQESNFNPGAVSPVGAQGIAQFMPATWPEWGVDGDGDGRADVMNPADAIPAAARYDCALAGYVSSVPGDHTDNMLAAYNAGSYRVIQYQGIPPYTETRDYVRNIRALSQSFAVVTAPLGPSSPAVVAINAAQSKLNTPYLWGGEGTPEDGGRFDCSGLTQWAYGLAGVTLPRVANDQWYAGAHPSRSELMPGDLVFFANNLNDPRSIHHVGIYVGGGYMINAPHTGAVIRFDKIDQPDYIGATRVTAAGAAALPDRATPQKAVGGAPMAQPDS